MHGFYERRKRYFQHELIVTVTALNGGYFKKTIMKIKDLKGQFLEIIDLDKAIRQAEIFKDYKYENKEFENINAERKSYWTDLYKKLLILKQQKK